MSKNKVVIIDKNIRGGVPCVEGTRIPVAKIIYLYKTKRLSPSTIALKYYTQISVDKIKGVISWFETNKNNYGMVI